MINECTLNPDICGLGKCIDTPTGYECLCNAGYRLGNSKKCEGMNNIQSKKKQFNNIIFGFRY